MKSGGIFLIKCGSMGLLECSFRLVNESVRMRDNALGKVYGVRWSDEAGEQWDRFQTNVTSNRCVEQEIQGS